MSTATTEAKPLVRHHGSSRSRSNRIILLTMLVAMILFALGCTGMWFAKTLNLSDSNWLLPVMFSPLAAFYLALVLTAIAKLSNEPDADKSDAERISSYLRENYGILVLASDCAVYCGNSANSSAKKVIPAEDLNTGSNIQITLSFSDDYRRVTPIVVKGSPMKSRVLA